MLMLLAYLALGIFVFGFAWRIWLYWKTPAPLKIPTTPAPVSQIGVVWRMFTEVALFHSLFKGNKWTWAGGIALHAALILVVIRHLRYFINPLPEIYAMVEIFGIVAGIVMVGALGFLLVRRFAVARTRYVSSPADYLIILLLLAIGTSGLAMTFIARPDIVTIKAAMIDWVTLAALFKGFPVFQDAAFNAHFLLVLVLLAIFPFSKLMHLGGIFFSPGRNQVDNPREVKHVNPWAAN